MILLLTGFEPFEGSKMNPSEQVARALEGVCFGPTWVVTALLPVDQAQGPHALLDAIAAHRPDAVLCLGQATARTGLSVERVALNLLDFRVPDNAGNAPVDQPVIPGGPAAYFATLPVRAVVEAIRAAGVPAELSLSAGSYLCNQVMYTLLHSLAAGDRAIPGGFIHLPCLPEQVIESGKAVPSMSLDTMITGVRAALEIVANTLSPAPCPKSGEG